MTMKYKKYNWQGTIYTSDWSLLDKRNNSIWVDNCPCPSGVQCLVKEVCRFTHTSTCINTPNAPYGCRIARLNDEFNLLLEQFFTMRINRSIKALPSYTEPTEIDKMDYGDTSSSSSSSGNKSDIECCSSSGSSSSSEDSGDDVLYRPSNETGDMISADRLIKEGKRSSSSSYSRFIPPRYSLFTPYHAFKDLLRECGLTMRPIYCKWGERCKRYMCSYAHSIKQMTNLFSDERIVSFYRDVAKIRTEMYKPVHYVVRDTCTIQCANTACSKKMVNTLEPVEVNLRLFDPIDGRLYYPSCIIKCLVCKRPSTLSVYI